MSSAVEYSTTLKVTFRLFLVLQFGSTLDMFFSNIKIGGIDVEQVDHAKLLGVTFFHV